jgi:hypothetical protein
MTQWGLDTLFNPAKRHMDEEKRRLQSTREEVGDSSGGKRIDLESGKVTISRGQPKDADADADVQADADADVQADADADSPEPVDGAAAESQTDTATEAAHSETTEADQPG